MSSSDAVPMSAVDAEDYISRIPKNISHIQGILPNLTTTHICAVQAVNSFYCILDHYDLSTESK